MCAEVQLWQTRQALAARKVKSKLSEAKEARPVRAETHSDDRGSAGCCKVESAHSEMK